MTAPDLFVGKVATVRARIHVVNPQPSSSAGDRAGGPKGPTSTTKGNTLRAEPTPPRLHRRATSDRTLLIIATIPVGISGLLLEHSVRTLFAQPAAAIFLTINGLMLLAGERLRRTAPTDETEMSAVPVGITWNRSPQAGTPPWNPTPPARPHGPPAGWRR